MSDFENLNTKRADAAGDSQLHTVTDCLEDALKASRGGHWKKCLLVFYHEEDGKFQTQMRCAGVTALEARGLMFSWMREEILEEVFP